MGALPPNPQSVFDQMKRTVENMSHSERHAGAVLVDCLRAQNVRRVFAVPGESYLAALDGSA